MLQQNKFPRIIFIMVNKNSNTWNFSLTLKKFNPNLRGVGSNFTRGWFSLNNSEAVKPVQFPVIRQN